MKPVDYIYLNPSVNTFLNITEVKNNSDGATVLYCKWYTTTVIVYKLSLEQALQFISKVIKYTAKKCWSW